VVRASSLLTFVSGSLKFVIYDAKLIADSSLLVMMNGRTTLEGKTVMEERSNQLSTLLSLFADLEVHSRRPRLILNLPNLFVRGRANRRVAYVPSDSQKAIQSL